MSEGALGLPGVSAIDAQRGVQAPLGVDADIQDYFGSIDPTLLLDRIAERVANGSGLRGVREMLQAGVREEGRRAATGVCYP